MMTSRLRINHNDDGAMLVLALILITVVALVTGALLTVGGAKLVATTTLRTVAGNAYAADAAAKIAINDINWGGSSTVPSTTATYPNGVAGTPASWAYDNNTDGTGCFGKSTASGNPALDRITVPNVYTEPHSGAQQTATIVCTPVTGTGLFSSGTGGVPVQPAATDPFARALTTVGTGNCTPQVSGGSCSRGIYFKGLGSGTEIPIRGSIQSLNDVTIDAGTLRTNGTVYCTNLTGPIITAAGNGCTGSFVSTTVPTSPLTSVPTWQNPATQGCSFAPGFYNNGAALSTAVNACSTAVFTSGKYYFDFADGNPWDISTTVVGGVPTGDTTIPGRCVSPIDSGTTTGVQFVFGASSYVQAEDSAHVELCGPANAGLAPLTLVQQPTGSSPGPTSVPATGTVTAGTVTAVPVGGKNDAFSPASPNSATPVAALAASGNPTMDWKSTKNGNTGGIDLQNFAGLSGIPVGSTITSAQLNVKYTNGLTIANPTTAFTAGISGQAGTVKVQPSTTNTDMTALMNARFQSSASGFSATNPQIQLRIADSTKNDTFSVDYVTLTVTYTAPALRAATGPATFITDHGGNFAGQFVVQGATYAPNGYITLVPGSAPNALVAFRWGVYAWGVAFKSQPSQTWGYPLISIPDVSYGLGSAVTAVDLNVFLCTGPSACATTGTPALTSRVQFTDGVDSNGIVYPKVGQRQINVISWAEQK